jgi:hypothetical protein
MFVGNLNVSLLAGHKGRSRREKQALLIAKNHLVKRIVKLNRDFDLVDFFIAAIFHRAENISNFLVQKIRCAAHLRFEKMDLLSISFCLRAKGHGTVIFGNGGCGIVAVENRSGDKDRNDDNSDQECDRQPAPFFCGHQSENPPDSLSFLLRRIKCCRRLPSLDFRAALWRPPSGGHYMDQN